MRGSRRRRAEQERARIAELQERVERLRARRAELEQQDRPRDLAAVVEELDLTNERLMELTDLRRFDLLGD